MEFGGIWDAFSVSADDNLILHIFQFLTPGEAQSAVETSTGFVARITEVPSQSCVEVAGKTLENQTILRQLLVAWLGHAIVDSVDTALTRSLVAVQSDSNQALGFCRMSRLLILLRVLVAKQTVAHAFLLAKKIADIGGAAGGCAATSRIDLADRFLDSFFRAELFLAKDRKADCVASDGLSKTRQGVTVAQTADVALNALFSCDERGRNVLLHSAAALRLADQKLEGVYDNEFDPRNYALVARRRSAVEFLLRRVPADSCNFEASGQELHAAAQAFDQTVRSCVVEGFELSCRHLEPGAPYSHWWLFSGSADMPGKCGLCG